MKKVALAISLFIIFISNASAQFTVGSKIGLNLSKEYHEIKTIRESADFKQGLNVGLFGGYQINENFDVQSELQYSQQGFKCNVSIVDIEGIFIGDGYKVLSHYLNVPILLKYYPFERFYIEAGPQVGFCFDSKISSPNDYINRNFAPDYNPIDFSLAGGIGFHVGYGLSINARYNHGFTNTLSNSKWKNRVIQLSISCDLWRF